jgi:ribosomal protein S18 acetylase RimI-like enzyme
MNAAFYRDLLRQHGMGALCYHLAYRAANHLLHLRVWNTLVITVDTIDPGILAESRAAGVRMLEAAAMSPYADDPHYGLSRQTLDEAIARGDRCAAIFDGDVLAAYGWYATQPIRLLEVAGAPLLHFDPAYAYMYNGYTHPAYRGRRLHAIGMAAALEAYTKEGRAGLVSYVDSSNFSSLKSCRRMGYRSFGRVSMFVLGTRQHYRSTSGCKRYDFRIEPVAG